MFRNFKTIRLAISIIVTLQFGFLMPLAPVLAQEAANLPVEINNVDIVSGSDDDVTIGSMQLDLGNTEPDVLIDNLTITENETDSLDNETLVEDVDALNFSLDSNSDDIPVSQINFTPTNPESEEVIIGDASLDVNTSSVQNEEDDTILDSSSTDNLAQKEQLSDDQINIILDNKQAADEVFEDILILDEPEQEEIVIDDALFEVVDEYIDIADLADGKKAMRIYSEPRLFYQDERGMSKIRPDGWNLFSENNRSKLKQNDINTYSFYAPIDDDIKVKFHGFEIDGNSQTTNRGNFSQRKDNSVTLSEYKNIYDGIDIVFKDLKWKRDKEIIINELPWGIKDKNEIIFWEKLNFPEDSIVYTEDDVRLDGDKKIFNQSVYIQTTSGFRFVVTPSYIFDSIVKNDNDFDLYSEPLEQIVRVDYTNNELLIGLIVSVDYLTDPERIFPITIDPTYYACQEGYSGSYPLSCSLMDGYFRQYNDGTNTTYKTQTTLFTGYSDTDNATREIFLWFDMPWMNNYTVDSAYLKMRYKNSGNGSYTGDVGLRAKKINASWSVTSDDYYDVRSYKNTYVNEQNISKNSNDTWYSWSVATIVRSWVEDGEPNYGFLVEPNNSWTSGYPPNWPKRLSVFYSSEDSGNNGPYLQIVLSPKPVSKPDLTIYSKSLSKTTVKPDETITAFVEVKNYGTGNAGSSYVGYYYSTDSSCSVSDTYLAEDSTESLSAGQTSVQDSAPITIPTNATVGSIRYICFYADYKEGIDEGVNEDNNSASVAITIEDPIPTDPHEPNNSYSQAEYLGSGTNYSWNNSYLTANDQDWFKFSYNGSYYYFKVRGLNGSDIGKYGVSFNRAGSVVTIETSQVDTSVDTYLELYGTNGTSLLADDDDGGSGVFSKLTYDVNPNQPPSTCTLTSPSNGASNQNTSLTLGWSCSDFDGSVVNHYLEMDDISNFSSPFYSSWLGNANSSASVSNLSYSTTYYWRVKAKDDDNAEGSFNNPAWYFTTKSQPAAGGGSSCGASCDPNNNNDGDTQVETEEAKEGLSDNVPNISPVSEVSKKQYSYKNDDKGADPVNLRTGSFELTQTDLVLQGRGEDIDFTRYYDSKTEKNARFGVGWKYSYNQYYFKDPATGKVVVYKGGSVANIFEYDGVKYTSPGETDKLYPDATDTYLILEKFSGIKYYYSTKLTDNMGLLQKILDTNGNITQFNYVEKRAVDMLTQVVDSSGRSIVFEYGDILNDKMWDKITKLTYSTGDPNTKTTIDYVYEELSGGVVVLKEVKRTRLYDGQSEIQIDKFTYAKYDSDIYRLATQEDARGTILYNTYDSEGRTTVQKEYNPNVDEVGDPHLVWTLDYLGEDPSVVGDQYCTLVKNYPDEVNHTDQKFCYNSDHLKVYENNSGNKITYTRDANGMITKVVRDNGVNGSAETQYEYDGQKRVVKEILPDTDFYHTETWYTYGAFNRVENKYIYVWDLGEDYTAPNANVTKYTSYNINPLNGDILSVTYPDNITESFTYDAYGNVLKHTDKNGNVVNYTYDVGGNYVLSETKSVTLPDGSNQIIKKQYQYDEYGNRIKYTSPRNFDFTYEYDNRGNLREENNPLGGSKTYEYDIESHRTAMYDELNRRTEYVYAMDISASLLQEKKYSLDEIKIISISTDYDNLGRVKTTYDGNGNKMNFVYDGDGRIYKKIEPYKTTEFVYYNNGNVQFEIVYQTDQSSANWLNKTEYLYDARNNLLESKQYKDNNYLSTFYEYDGFNRITKSIDGNGGETIHTYDLNDRLIMTVDPAGNTTTLNYDDNGNKIGEKLPRCFADQSNCNSLGYSNSYYYDGANRLIKVVNADNKETIYYYNEDGQATKTIDLQNSNGTSNTHKTEYIYDALSRKTQECDSYNQCVIYNYNEVGNLTKVTDQIGRQTVYTYDDFNRLITEIDPAGKTNSYTYDNNGNKKTITYPDNKKTEYTYDYANHLTEIKDHLNNTRTFGYDAIGNKILEKSKMGDTTNFSYDKLNRLTSETNPQGTVTTYTYDNNSNRLTEDVAGKVRTYIYDDLNLVTQISHPGNKTESYTYDSEGNALTKTDGNIQTINYTYDKLNRLILKELPEGDSVVYTYDNWDNLLTLSDETGSTSYTYDNNNQQLQEQKTLTDLNQSYTIARTYYADGQLKTLTDASGIVITYEYNNRGLLQNVKNNTQTLASYTYTAQGLPEVLTYDNEVQTNYTYDDLHRVSVLEITNASSTSLFKHEYTYDAESNRTKLIENDTKTVNYIYDDLDQLTGVTYLDDKGNQNIGITYDIWGNRTLLNTSFGSINYNYDQNNNELTSYSQNGRLDTNLTYDGNGSLTQETYSRLGKDIRTVNYSWDSQNRLKQIEYAYLGRPAYLPTLPNNVMEFAYDDFGNRIKKTVNNEASYYLNNGLTVLNEITETGTIDKSVVQGLGQIAEIDKDGNIQFIHTEVLGSTILITNEQGEVIAEYEYDVFGSIIGQSGTAETNYLFTNQEFDSESELYYYNARYYNPTTGRFISRDPFLGRDGDVLSRNSYIYVKNNPLKYVDPTGEEEIGVCSFTSNSLLNKQLYWEQAPKGFSDYVGNAADFFNDVADYNYQNGNWAQKAGGFISGMIGSTLENVSVVTDPNSDRWEFTDSAFWLGVDAVTFGRGSIVKQGAKEGVVGGTTKIVKELSTDSRVIKGVADIGGFSSHGIDQIINRGITPNLIKETVENTIKYVERVDELGRESFRYIGDKAVLNFNKANEFITGWLK